MKDEIDDQKLCEIKQSSSFKLDSAFERGEKMMKKKLDRLNIEFDEGFDDTPEKAQQYNFMAYMYLYWKFEERPNAFAFIERVEILKEGTNTIT